MGGENDLSLFGGTAKGSSARSASVVAIQASKLNLETFFFCKSAKQVLGLESTVTSSTENISLKLVRR